MENDDIFTRENFIQMRNNLQDVTITIEALSRNYNHILTVLEIVKKEKDELQDYLNVTNKTLETTQAQLAEKTEQINNLEQARDNAEQALENARVEGRNEGRQQAQEEARIEAEQALENARRQYFDTDLENDIKCNSLTRICIISTESVRSH